MRLPSVTIFATIAAIVAGLTPTVVAQSPQSRGQTDVRLQPDEAVAALTIIRERASGGSPSPDDWQRLFTSQGYLRLQERQAFMHRAFTDSSFARFVTSDTLAAR